jgi:hypothetical protein
MTMFDPEISRGTRIVQAVGGFFVLAVLTGIITFLAVGWNGANADVRNTQHQLILEINKNETLQDEYNKLYREFTDATGKKPDAATPRQIQSTPGAQGATGQAGVRGQTGPQGPMGITGIAGSNGKNGVNGAPGSNGAPGASGADGKDGAQGPVGPPGPAGPPGADSTVPGPAGPPGATGPAGPPGPGRGIQSIDCQGADATSSWIITYTDGATQQVAGPCRFTIAP